MKIPTYMLDGVTGESAVTIKALGFIDTDLGEKLTDTPVYAYDIDDQIKGEIMACNFSGSHLISTKTLPMLCLVAYWETSTFRKKELYRIYLSFTITDDVTSEQQLLTKPLHGVFKLNWIRDNVDTPLNCSIDAFTDHQTLLNYLAEFSLVQGIKIVAGELVVREQNKIKEKYGEQFVYDSAPRSKSFKTLLEELTKAN